MIFPDSILLLLLLMQAGIPFPKSIIIVSSSEEAEFFDKYVGHIVFGLILKAFSIFIPIL